MSNQFVHYTLAQRRVARRSKSDNIRNASYEALESLAKSNNELNKAVDDTLAITLNRMPGSIFEAVVLLQHILRNETWPIFSTTGDLQSSLARALGFVTQARVDVQGVQNGEERSIIVQKALKKVERLITKAIKNISHSITEATILESLEQQVWAPRRNSERNARARSPIYRYSNEESQLESSEERDTDDYVQSETSGHDTD